MTSVKLKGYLSGAPSGLFGWLKDALSSNLGLKGLSLLFALGLVVYQREQQNEQQLSIPVGIVLRLPNDAANRELMTTMPVNVHITVRGASNAIETMVQTGVPPVALDLRDGKIERVVFDRGMFSLPHDVELKVIDPPTVDLEWEDVIVRQIPIQSSITGDLADGYEKGEVVVDPKTTTVRGPASLVEVMQFGRLAAFDVAGKTDGVYRHQIALDPPPARIKYIGATSATVTVQIRRRMIHQTFPNLAVEIVGSVPATIKPRTVDVTVHGPPEVIAALRKSLVVPQVDLQAVVTGKPHGTAALPVKVDLAKAEVETQPPSVVVSW